MPPRKPCELTPELASFIRETAQRIFGSEVVVRNYGIDPKALRIHVETDAHNLVVADFIGALVTRINHIPSVSVTESGAKPQGDAKIAYRQGDVL
ncbi:hypothetical protein [Novosphingobium sp. ST904]|uniref:hypothetical protein n=1 Tax=Novosphingobium sp. ST904 TaxID=1684385 RepID=UPI0006CC662B|nr:hypothetical protein [Novosphingobium sp. ST904]KPH60303.1 hypothetical protein ADT71_21215 [Novosphingobium sp. ST904]TCM36798.1 hypothetical protein EDF59_11332 [Novosphingobium sp. ST904]